MSELFELGKNSKMGVFYKRKAIIERIRKNMT